MASPGLMHEAGCSGLVHWDDLRDGMGREVGGKVRIGNTCTLMADSCDCMAKPPQHCKVISLQLKLKKNNKDRRNKKRKEKVM